MRSEALAAGGLADVLGYQLAQASVTTARVFQHAVGTPHELRPVEYTVLQLIAENPATSPVKLAKVLSVTKPNMTMWVERLVGRGLVQRSPSSSDKRAQELRTTAEGQALAVRATALLREGEQALLSALSPGERVILTELLQKVASAGQR